ncbi:RNA polymerase I transcription factor UAF [Handroanthus impetiginosus]|uniref:RNA polymerase I transcription factor UAF n=1 Tax=Handroanthus impetiginosus TaxID=429701 RepID=A0A2G9IAS3_9LAMI|nr:RNA polymerase I transcription factor UAF [Handroanthus impetiginosus]
MENIETLLAAVAQTQGFDDGQPAVSTAPKLRIENSGSGLDMRRDISGSQLTGEISGDARPSAVVDMHPPAVALAYPAAALAYPAAGRMIGLEEKRKRGRPPRGQLVAKPPPPKRAKVEDEEEDVCFICFDGGSLVLCDRKGCPKAYHPACIKRDEAFFKSRAKWTCGWHICSVCRKASHYMCYTCTYSLCKGCTKDADYVCVRGNKGFCSTCMKTIMLIENKDQANSELVQVDFDDQTSWEYLFKVYWVYLKEKLSLKLSELTQAKNPWKGVAAVAGKPQLSNVLHTAVDGKVSISYKSTEHLELNKPQAELSLSQNDGIRTVQSSVDNHVESLNSNKSDRPSPNKDTVEPNMNKVTDDLSIDKATNEPGIKETTERPDIKKDLENPSTIKNTDKPCICRNTNDKVLDKPGTDSNSEWASKDLLEFVAHMKNGDASPISQFDVQNLLLDYIKRNNLRDPRRKSQIICDTRLKNIFGKPRVGHIEMLKLLEYHFLIKEDTQKSSFIPAGLVCSDASDMEVDGNIYGLLMPSKIRRRKKRKKSEETSAQNNLNEYAAIDVHNVNLIYLRRNLTENLTEDHENFNDKVVGSIVRIRVSSNDQKQDVYRLVQVVGTRKVAEPYKIGDRTADVMLEVLNLNKKDVVSIDAISNQEFTEDECRRLRQSIRCGLVKRFTVGEIQKKAMALQPVRVNDWLEAEILRLNHLRDRASEKGRKKELREYVEKLQLLKSPEERQRRISEVPEIHADPKMSPNYESEEDNRIHDDVKKDEYVRSSYSVFPPNGRKPISPSKKGKEVQAIQKQNRMIEKTGASGSHSSDKHTNQVNINNSAVGGRKDQAMQRSGLEASTSTASVGKSQPTDNIGIEKLWHYRDPNGRIQGPFSMMQLQKWSKTGFFPPDMRIWTNHEQYDSVLLTDALTGKFHGALELSHKPSSGLQESGATKGFLVSECTNETGADGKESEAAGCNNTSVLSDNKTGFMGADDPSSSAQCGDLLKDNNSSADDVQAHNLLPSSGLGQTDVLPADRGQECDEVNHGSQNGDKNSTVLTQTPTAGGHELQNQSNDRDRAGISSEENLRSVNVDLSSNDMETASDSAPVSKLPDSNKQAGIIDVLDLPSPTPKTPENQPPVSSDVPMQNSGILELVSPTPRSNTDDQGGQATETEDSGLINFPMPNSGPSWNGASSLDVGSVQLPEVADEWFRYSPAPGKPSLEEWDSGLVSASSSKPPEVTSENIGMSTSGDHHTPNMTNWLANTNEPIEFHVLGEEYVSDLLAEVDAMESRGALPSPTSAMKFAKELIQDCKDDCFSSIEEFSPTPDPQRSDAFSSTGEIQLTSQSSEPCKQIESSPIDAFDFFRRSSVHSSASSEGETNCPVYSADSSSEFHPPAPNQELVGATTMAPDTTDPGWGTVQGNINLVTVQGNVNLVLGGPTQGMANLSWGTSQGTPWSNPGINRNPVNASLPWDGQRKYGERFNSPREWGYQGRPPWSRQPYGGGGYNRPLPKGQRVCKFFESGHCKKGAFCDYLHP